MPPIIPIYLKSETEAPADPLYYVVAANGTFLVRKTLLFTATTTVNEVIGLEPEAPAVALHFPKIPRAIMERVLGFFRLVYRRWDGEAVVVLFYSPERGEFLADAPPQVLQRFRSRDRWRTEGRVEYGAIARPDGFLKLGDVHSHGDCAAFFSRTDDRDDDEDGLRIVVGRVDRARLDVCASFVANGCRFSLSPRDVIETSSAPFSPVAPPEEWVRRVVCRYETSRTDQCRAIEHEH